MVNVTEAPTGLVSTTFHVPEATPVKFNTADIEVALVTDTDEAITSGEPDLVNFTELPEEKFIPVSATATEEPEFPDDGETADKVGTAGVAITENAFARVAT